MVDKRKIAVVIPVYLANELHDDFTRQTLRSIHSEKYDLQNYVIINYSLPQFKPQAEDYKHLHLTVVDNPAGNHVGSAWNMGIKMGFEAGAEYVIVANNDIILHKTAIDNLVDFADSHPEFILWSAAEWQNLRTIFTVEDVEFTTDFDEHPHFSCFMVNKKTIDTVGWFDEKLHTAYFEDGEYHYRILLSGNKASKTATSRFYHYGSRSIRVDEDLFMKNRRTYEDNRKYIRSKWNTDFHGKAFDPPESVFNEEGIYKHPFNNPKNDWRFW